MSCINSKLLNSKNLIETKNFWKFSLSRCFRVALRGKLNFLWRPKLHLSKNKKIFVIFKKLSILFVFQNKFWQLKKTRKTVKSGASFAVWKISQNRCMKSITYYRFAKFREHHKKFNVDWNFFRTLSLGCLPIKGRK